ncbi:MAG: hypothetical protein U5K79_13190 [Cyclobacteriaceae bacterium]|nr:hypothetical protein [Cyclobacteriaceae bacterium]
MIRFNQPRYILPIIILPFIYIFYFLFHSDSMGSPSGKMVLEEMEGLNPTIPGPILDRVEQNDKFEAYLVSHKNKRDFSAMQEIDNTKEKDFMARDSVSTDRSRPSDTIPNSRTKSIGNNKSESEQQFRLPDSQKPDADAFRQDEDYRKQMELFKSQMLFMDSLFYQNEEMGYNQMMRCKMGNDEKGGSAKGIGKARTIVWCPQGRCCR